MMLLNYSGIDIDSCAADIVKKYYRTAEVFRRHGIEYCCGGKWPLKMVCETRDIDPEQLLNELRVAARDIRISNKLPFSEWDTDFIISYIVNIHHQYLKQMLPSLKEQLEKFVDEHREKYGYLSELERLFNFVYKTIIPHLREEEDVIFPYIRQIAHAYESKESYAGLLVRTLRKPVESMMHQEHETMGKVLKEFRTMTDNYTTPANACTSHRLSFCLLQELDDDLVQHLYLENVVLFPRALAMEKELLQRPA
ncbi:MAG TPA: DUF542 domain-containing protein [Chitinophagaceae bacterium]|nr:DUF542 domain-containing protein [Chitinophagaceae bacterium]